MSPKHRTTQDDEALNGLPPIGPELRARRQQHGIELTHAAGTLRIKQSYLAALEEGRYSDLPGAAYAIGFVRTYGDYLGFDGAEVVRRFKHEAAGGLSRPTTLTFPSPAPRGRVPGTAPLLIALIIAAGIAGAWYLWRDEAQSLFGQVPEVPERLMAALNPGQQQAPEAAPPASTPQTLIAPPPAAPTAVTPPVQVPPPVATAPDAARHATAPTVGQTITLPPPPVPTPSAAAANPPTVAAVQPPPTPPQPVEQSRRLAPIPPPPPAVTADRGASVGEDEVPPAPSGPEDTANAATAPTEATAPPPPPAPPADGRVFGSVNDPVRIVIKSKGDSWVQVRDADNQPVMTRVLRAGDTYRVPNRQGLVLMTGNAGALEVSVDGQAAPALGPIGMVRRAVPLDAERLKTGTLPAE
jgi:cytoskeleton protein RodZ